MNLKFWIILVSSLFWVKSITGFKHVKSRTTKNKFSKCLININYVLRAAKITHVAESRLPTTDYEK